ncbi:hypothetical protein FHG87_010485 [Trinorchestia longiramus]|nr:hypothetical protein FHG87_010485 [Trinorchestia longiramus]
MLPYVLPSWSATWVQKVFLLSLCVDSSAQKKHLIETNWPPRSDLKPRDPNIQSKLLNNRKKMTFSLLHIKLYLMKQLVKALATDGDCLKYILQFDRVSFEKSNSSMFGGIQIRSLIID